jgi:photosystem II stability/assembly factor-like uncharacterized protein
MKKLSLLIFFILFIHSINTYSQFTWQQLNGPQGGLVSCIKSRAGGTLFLGSVGGGIYKSTDKGMTWTQKNNGFGRPAFDNGLVTIAIAPNGYLYASSFTDGIYLSSNNGESWVHSMTNGIVSEIIVDPFNRVYAAMDNGSGVYVSSNNGATWVQKSNGLTQGMDVNSICITDAGDLYAASVGPNSVYRSTNSAESWVPVNLSIVYARHIISKGNIVFAAASSIGIYRTSDNGANWELVNSGLTNLKINRFSVSGNTIAAASDSGVFCSSNNGNNWFKIGLDVKEITEVNILPNNTVLAAVQREGIYRTSNLGTNWLNSTTGFNCNAVLSIAFSGSSIYTGLEYNGLMRSTDSGNNWVKAANGFKGSSCRLVYTAPNGYLFAQSDTGFFRSTNSGNNWVMLWGPFSRFNTIVSNQSGHLFASGSYPASGVYRSTDNGSTWDMPDPNFMSSIYSLCISQSGTLFAGSSGGGVYRSTNNGVNWIQSQPSSSVHSLTITPNGNIFGHFYFSSGQTGIYRSTNNGVSWQYINFGNNDYYFLKTNSAGHIFAGGFYGAGLYRSTNNGVNWSQVSEGIFNRMITTIVFDNAGYSYTGTYFGGVYKTNISTIGLSSLSTEIPDKFSLSQNYPNPFNPLTNIEFSVPEKSFVKLTIFDITGRTVEVLVNEQLSAGTYKADWNAANYSSGVYFYKIEGNAFTETKKMILTK